MQLYYTIGEVSRIFNISIETLRYYDQLDILKPYVVGDNRYRYYYIGQFEMISTIKLLKGLELSLNEIKALTHHEDLKKVCLALQEEQKSIHKKIDHLRLMEEKIKTICHNINKINTSEEIIVCMRPKFWALLTESLLESNDSELPKKIEKDLMMVDKSWTSLSNVVSVISKNNLLKGCYHSYLYNGLISTRPCSIDSSKLKIYEEEQCIFKCFSVDQDQYDVLDKEYDITKQWILDNEFEICGDALEINIYNQHLHDNIFRNHLQIWIPIKNRREIK